MDQTRDFSYFTIPAKQFAPTVKASDQAIQAYYKKHVGQFKIPEEVSINYIEISPTKLKKNIHPTPTDLQTFYQNHIDRTNGQFDTVKGYAWDAIDLAKYYKAQRDSFAIELLKIKKFQLQE